ncbi:protein Daple-like isoform X4 [Polyodon spathula]|uniref:protein Daple-like isoform X4 n=1 Tax=Polyodon spathula TaxID=7913 RepID=UPI001B7E6CC6|nr:protein Daple-like isoform X4 [Polyodon spathula]
MDVTVSELMKNFLKCPLVTWVKTFGPLGTGDEDKLSMYLELVDGVYLNKIMLKIDPSPTNQRVNKNVNSDVNLRIQNLAILVRHIKNYYQENLQQLIVMNLPNVLTIGKDPLTGKSMEEMKRLLLLILGCAVQCERKEEFIEKIKQLDIETQAAIVTHIQEVTHNQENVFDLQWLEMPYLPHEDLDSLSRNMVFHLRKLIDERDDSSEVIVELTQERDYLQSQQPLCPVKTSSPETTPGPITLLSKEDRQHLAVDLADCKSKLRRTRQELEEKTEQLIDTKNEVDRLDLDLQKLKQENIQLTADARSLRAYRDELDSFREKASRVDKLETELARCKERLHDVHFYKARMEELREDNVTLIETKTMLEEQLTLARGRCDKLHELEKENLQLRSKLHDIELDRDTDKKRIEELSEENMVLEIAQKQSMNESAHLGWELEQMSRSTDVNDARKSFVFELNESASSRILKLEKENQGLQNTIQELRDTSLTLEEGNLRILELVKENQQLSKKIETLQFQLDQEKQTNQDMETLVEELLKEKQKLMKNMETMRGEKDRQISELEHESDHLNQTVTSLRQRAEVGSEARVKDVEKENRILHETITDTGSKLTQLEFEKKQVCKELVQLKEKVQKSEDLEKEVHKLECTNEQLQKKLASLTITCDKIEALEQENCTLEIENKKLKKLADNAHNAAFRIETMEKDNHQLEEENLEMRRTVETLKFTSTKLAQMELENKELEKEKEELARNMDMMKALSKKSERLEVSYQALDSENQRLQQTLENSNKKIQHLEKEVQDTEKENQQLQKSLEELRISSKRLEKLERDNRGLEQEVTQLEKDKKQLEKEAKRLWQQVEVKEAALDESGFAVATLEKERKTLEKELSKLKEASNKAREMERENKDMQKQATIDKRTLATLREDLVHEKLKSQQQSNELEKLNQELEKIGLNKEKLLQEEHSSDDNKYKILETKIESTLQETLEIKEEKIQSLESRLEESSSLNQQLRSELTSVKKNLEAMKQRQEEEAYHLNSAKSSPEKQPPNSQNKEKWETEHRETTMELLKVKDRVIDTEKCNAALQAEKHLLKEQLKQLDSQNNLLNSQIVALQRQAASLQEHNTALQTQTAKLQVENSTLNSQSASLMAQNAMLQSQQSSMETEAENVVKQKEELKAAHESLLLDHERFMALHERQSVEYETLISQHGSLKMTHKALEHEYRDLNDRYGVLLRQKAAMEELEMVLKSERENLAMEKQKNTLLLGENNNLKEEIDRFTFMHRQLQEEYDGLQLHTKELKTALNNGQLDLNRWQARYDELKEQHQSLDISLTKLDNHCELLNRLKGNLEEENHHLLSQIQMLSQQNQTLLERTMESKELYHEEQKQCIDKLNTLRRQKEKLEEKIMDQYKFYDPAPKKKNNWVGAKALVKLIKPKKDGSRERPKSTPESLAQPLDYPEGLPPLPPPPLPPRLSHLSLDNNLLGSNSLEENHNHSPTTRALNDSGLRLRGTYRSTGSNENTESPEAISRRRRMELGSMAYSTSAIHMSASSSTPVPGSRQTLRPKGFISDDDLRLQLLDAVFANSSNGTQAYKPNTLDHSRNTSSSSSPVNSKGSCDRIQGSLSSDEVISGHEAATLPREGCLYRSRSAFVSSSKQEPGLCAKGLASYDTTQKGAPSHPQGRARPRLGSPSGELVTLEEFLQESNNLSPPTVQTNSREDLMSDYFKKINVSPIIGKQSALKDVAKMPTNYVMPTIKAVPDDSLDGRSKPGQTVKPSIRPPEPQPQTSSNAASIRQTQTLPTRSRQAERLAQTQQQPGTRGGSGNLSRTFSLASADLLRSNGPDNCRQESSPKPATELNPSPGIVVRRQATIAHERPQSARLSGFSSQGGELHYRTVDPRRLSLAPPKDDPRPLSPQKHPQHQSSTVSLSGSVNNPNVARTQAERYCATSSPHYCPAQQGPPRSEPQQPSVRPVSQHRGEVAMVTPVRAVPLPKEEEVIGEQRPMDTSLSKSLAKSPERGSSTEGPGTEDLNQSNSSAHKSTPASPDPSNDPQSVWYEYGCV